MLSIFFLLIAVPGILASDQVTEFPLSNVYIQYVYVSTIMFTYNICIYNFIHKHSFRWVEVIN